MKKKVVAIIGTNGIPARYGGFETLAENIVLNLNNEYEFIVYCSREQKKKGEIKNFHGAKLIYLPLKANGWQSMIYDTLSTFHALLKADTLVILGPAAGFILFSNLLFRKRIIVNHGGLNEWEREKYNYIEKRIIRINHSIASRYANINIADNNLLKASIYKNYNKDSIVIRYGGDHARPIKINTHLLSKYPFLTSDYYVSVSRAQVDNNLHILLEAFEALPNKNLVIISNWNVSEYGNNLYSKYNNATHNIILLNAIYDQEELNCIRSNAILYIHSHSRCGTSPSLVEALSLDLPVISFDVPANRETLKGSSLFFKSSKELIQLINKMEPSIVTKLKEDTIALKEDYKWGKIAQEYSEIF